jgi:hypothetical protein
MNFLLPYTMAGFEPGLLALKADAITTAPRRSSGILFISLLNCFCCLLNFRPF